MIYEIVLKEIDKKQFITAMKRYPHNKFTDKGINTIYTWLDEWSDQEIMDIVDFQEYRFIEVPYDEKTHKELLTAGYTLLDVVALREIPEGNAVYQRPKENT